VSIPVAPAPLAVSEPVIVELGSTPAPAPPVIVSGMSYALNAPAGSDLGSLPGQILIKLNGMGLRSAVLQWQPQSAQFTAPRIDLADTIPATMAMVRADGSVVSETPILFAPPQTATAPPTSPATLAQTGSAP
jgi:hypothetical protein